MAPNRGQKHDWLTFGKPAVTKPAVGHQGGKKTTKENKK